MFVCAYEQGPGEEEPIHESYGSTTDGDSSMLGAITKPKPWSLLADSSAYHSPPKFHLLFCFPVRPQAMLQG